MASCSRLLFRVPVDQRRANPGAYDPYLFAFGLSNFEVRRSYDADHFKQMAVRALVRGEGAFASLAAKIERRLSDIRALYIPERHLGSLAHLSDQSLAALFAVDAVAIVAAAVKPDVFQAYPITCLVFKDAILLENQIPIFVLQYAMESLDPASIGAAPARTTIHHVLRQYYKCASPFPSLEPPPSSALQAHMSDQPGLLAHIYDCMTRTPTQAEQQDSKCVISFDDHLPPALTTASHLRRCGVRCRPCDASFSGISFDEKAMVLSLPRIVVGHTTPRFLHNLLAYEATSRFPRHSSVISYVYFMDRLIDSDEDVRLLAEAGVIRNALGSHEELAYVWHKLCISMLCGTTQKDRQTMEKLNRRTRTKWRRWMAAFKETYWERQPWLLVSILAGTVLLVLTFLQTIYTLKGS